MTVNRRSFLKGMAAVPVVAAVALEDNPVTAGRKELWYFEKSNTTMMPIYEDRALTIPSVNPLVANEDGSFPEVFVNGTDYRGVLRDATGEHHFVSMGT